MSPGVCATQRVVVYHRPPLAILVRRFPKVIGVGGGGSNAVKRMMESEIQGVEFWSLNTDVQALARVQGARTMTIGNTITRGLGAGGVPEIGRRAADESRQQIADITTGTDLVFVTAGMGGGTGGVEVPTPRATHPNHTIS